MNTSCMPELILDAHLFELPLQVRHLTVVVQLASQAVYLPLQPLALRLQPRILALCCLACCLQICIGPVQAPQLLQQLCWRLRQRLCLLLPLLLSTSYARPQPKGREFCLHSCLMVRCM